MTLITLPVAPITEGMGTTLTPLVASYLAQRGGQGDICSDTVAAYRYALIGFADCFGRRPLDRLGRKAIDRWLATIGHLAPATRRRHISTVRGFCRWLVETGKLRTDPCAHVKPVRQPRRQPRTLRPAEVGRLLSVAPDLRARAIIWLMVGCGCRCGEVAALDVSDWDPITRTLLLRGKGGHERIVPVPTDAARAIDAYLDATGVVGGPLIRSHRLPRAGLAPHTIGRMVRGWMWEAGVKTAPLDGRSAHALRRTCASDVMDRVGDIRVVQELLGHQFAETTARHYLRPVSLDAMRDAMEGRAYLEVA